MHAMAAHPPEMGMHCAEGEIRHGPGPEAAAALLTDAGRDAEAELAAGAVLPGSRTSTSGSMCTPRG